VVSASKDAPFKKVDFEKELEDFDKAKTYAEWKFEAKPSSGPAPQGNTSTASTTPDSPATSAPSGPHR
jgi:hypothetical protein